MYLSLDTIRQNAGSNTVYERGERYHRSGRVLNCSYTIYEGRVCDIDALVLGSNVYHVTVTISDGIIEEYECTCPASVKFVGMCKHCVAALLEARDELKKNGDLYRATGGEKPSASPARNAGKQLSLPPKAVSSSGAKALLDRYEQDDQASQMEEFNGQIHIEMTVELSTIVNSVEASLKVGASRMYVVKNMEDFLFAFARQEVRSYGKGLCFRHCEAALDEESRWLYGFLRKHFPANQLWHIEEPYHTDPKLYHLSGSALDELFERYTGLTFPLHFYSGSVRSDAPTALSFMKNTPNVKLSVAITDQQAIELRCERHTVYWGQKAFYMRVRGELFRYGGEASAALHRLTSAFLEANGLLVFAPEDFTVFCSTVLPGIKPYVKFSDPNGLLNQYLPESMSAHAFLDAPSRDRVVCALAAEYGGDLIDLATGKSLPRLKPLVLVPEEEGEPEPPAIAGALTGGSDGDTGPAPSPAAEKSAEHHRDPRAERLLAAKAAAIFGVGSQEALAVTGDDKIYELMTTGVEQLQAIATVHVSDRLRRYTQSPPIGVTIGVTLDSGLLKMAIDLERFSPEELLQALAAYRERRKYYRLKDGAFLRLNELDDVAQMTDGLQLTDRQLAEGYAETPAYRAMYLDGLFSEANRKTSLRKDSGFKRLVRTIKSSADSDHAVPQALRGVLRAYQETGYRWLKALEECNLCGILADDMGLGKSVQLIALLLSDQPTADKPSLIACPASLVLNWKAELAKFAPALPVRVIIGTAAAREALITHIAPGEVVITSYDLLKRDVTLYRDMVFQTFAIDEAQFIKNHATKSAHAVKEINCIQRFALTGTPIENRLSELWSIFDFLMPGYLFNYNRFRQRFEAPIIKDGDEEARAQLKRMIAPFVLRRLKRDVLRELPPKITTALPVELGEEQRKLYTAVLADGLLGLKAEAEKSADAASPSSGEAKIKVLALLTRLRQLCCDPSLCYENYGGESAKLESCMELIDEARNGGHKALVFSQFTSMLAIIEKRLKREGIRYYLLQGSTPKEERLEMADRFNADDTTVFLISLKAGGTGLNLTGADMVIHYDPWWNLAAQEQATDRAHRIGQSKSLQVYKLIAMGTVEEKIVKLQEMKGDLASIVDGDGENAFSALSAEEWIKLLEG